MIVFARGKDNRRIPMQVTASPIRDEAGKVIGGVETFRDASPMLVDLERAQKILAQSLAHEIPDDSMLLFSDGAVEIENAQGEWLGIDGFVQILKRLDYPNVQLCMDALEKELLKFSNDF